MKSQGDNTGFGPRDDLERSSHRQLDRGKKWWNPIILMN